MIKHGTDKVLQKYTELLCVKLGSRLHEVWLFGSRARGDFRPNSDFDILVVADGDSHELSDIAVDNSYSILCEFSELIGPLTYSPEVWEKEKHSSLGRNILRDGILLYESR